MLAYITLFNSTGALASSVPDIAATDIRGPKSHESRHDKYSEARTERRLQKASKHTRGFARK